MRWRPRPPGLAWLLAHELRLLWRGGGGVRSRVLVFLGVLVIAAAHLAGWGMMRSFDVDRAFDRAPLMIHFFTVFALLLLVSSAFGLAARTLFERGDMDLLLSSPVPMTRIYAIRGIAVALGCVATVAVFMLPVANMGPFHGKWGSLAAYPVLAAIGLGCAAVGFAGTLGLVRWLGFRRARVASQVVGAVLGAVVVLLLQAEQYLPHETRGAVLAWVKGDAAAWAGPGSPLTWPLRGMMGQPLPALAVIALGIALFAIVVRFTCATFVRSVQDAPSVPAGRKSARPTRTRAFRAGLARVVIAKELTLILRDPALVAKSLLQVIYLVPLFMVLARKSQPAALLAPGIVLLAASLAGTLAWMTVSGEESPDLIGAAPVSKERVRWLKVAAAMLPVVALVLPFLAWFAAQSLYSVAVLAMSLAAALASAAVVQVWTGQPGSGRDLRVRYRQGVLVNLAEQLSSVGWAMACFLALTMSPYALAGVALGLLAPVAAWFSAGNRASN